MKSISMSTTLKFITLILFGIWVTIEYGVITICFISLFGLLICSLLIMIQIELYYNTKNKE